MLDLQQAQGPAPAQKAGDRPEPTDREKAHVRKLLKLVDDALDLNKERFALFEKWRKAYAGYLSGEETAASQARSNMVYGNIAALMPQVYAKNPDFSFSPSPAVDPKQYDLVKKFAETSEVVVTRQLKDAKLKTNAKASVRSAMTTSIGWWKVTFQEDRRIDPIVLNRINDVQDNLERIKSLSEQVAKDGQAPGEDLEAKQQELQMQLSMLSQSPEITVGRGITIDTALAENVIILDSTIKSFHEYPRANRIAHRIWLSEDAFYDTFGYKPEKATRYAVVGDDQGGGGGVRAGERAEGYYCVFEIWDQTANTVFTVCRGEQGYCRQPYVPQTVGRRWYPFFALGFNPVDGRFYPLSDVELMLKLVEEYNQTRDDLAKHREENLPVRLARKGGALTEEDAQKIQNRESGDLIFVNGVAGRPIGEDIAEFKGIPVDPNNYDTSPIRSDIEQILGGGDAARGTVMKAKTATEAEIMAQGLRSRTEERQDTIEDMLQEVAQYVFEICLRELTVEEVMRIAGPQAVWPELSLDEALTMVNIEIKAGTSGKPNKLQEQDRWIQLLPIVKEAMMTIVELRNAGQPDLADGMLELLRETFKRFDERIDIDKFIPPSSAGAALEELSPEQLRALVMQGQAQMQMLQQQLTELQDGNAQAEAEAQRQIAVHRATKEIDADPTLQPPPPLVPPAVEPEDDGQEAAMFQELNAKLDALQQAIMQMAMMQGQAQPQPPVIVDNTGMHAQNGVEAVIGTVQSGQQALIGAVQSGQEALMQAVEGQAQAIAAIAQEISKPKKRAVSIKTPDGRQYTGESLEQ